MYTIDTNKEREKSKMINFKEIEKRMEKEERKEQKKQSFWKYRIKTENYYILWWALPVAIPYIAYDKLKKLIYDKTPWSDERAKKVLDRVLSKELTLTTDETGKECYMLFSNRVDFTIKKNVSLRDRYWTEKFIYTLTNYLNDNYEIDGYKKEVVSRGGFLSECEIYFYKNRA